MPAGACDDGAVRANPSHIKVFEKILDKYTMYGIMSIMYCKSGRTYREYTKSPIARKNNCRNGDRKPRRGAIRA